MKKIHNNKSRAVNFRLTEKEYAHVCYEMRDSGIDSISDYMRMLCVGNPDKKALLINKNYLVSEIQEIINKLKQNIDNINDAKKETLEKLEEELWQI